MRILLFLLFPVFISAQINRAYGVIEIGSFPNSSATGPKFAYRPVDSSFYRWVSGNTWVKIVEPSIVPDTLYLKQLSGTTALVNGDTVDISTYLLHSDTASMLDPYIKLAGYGLSKLVGHTLQVDTSVISTKTYTNRFLLKSDTSSMLSKYIERGDTLGMLSAYIRSAGWGLLKTSHTLTVDSSKVASRYYASTLPTTIASGYLATSNGTNLVARNLFDNNTYVGILNSKPFALGQWTTAGRPTGTSGYMGYNTTLTGIDWYNGTRWATALESTFARGTSTRVPFFDANGQVTDNAAVTINTSAPFGRLEIRGSIDQKTLVVRRTNSSQTTNVFEVASEAGGTIVGINSNGYIDASDLRLRNNGRTAFRGVTNFSTFTDNVASTFFQVSNSLDGNRLLFTSESGNALARLAFLSTGAYVYNGSFASSPAPVSQFAVINTVSATQPMTIKLANPQNVDAFRITSSTDVKLFHVEKDGKVAIKNSTTAARDLDVNGEVRIRDLTTDAPVDIVGADADGDLGKFSLSGLSVSSGTLTAQNIGNTNLTLSGNRTLTGAGYSLKFPNMEFNIGDTTWIFSNGVRPYLYARSKTYKPNRDSVAGQIILNTNGPQANLQLLGSSNAGNNFSGAIFLYDLSANTSKNKGWFVANDQRNLTEDGLNFKQIGSGFSGFVSHYIMRNNGTFTVGNPTYSPVMSISHDTVIIGKLPIINANINGNSAYTEAPLKIINLGTVGSPSSSNSTIFNSIIRSQRHGTGASEAADLSKTQSNYIAGFATDGTVLDLNADTLLKKEKYFTITSTSSPQTLSNNFSDNLINQGSTQATFTLKFPASPVDGQVLKITYNNAITTLTLDGNGNTIVGSAVTTGVAGSQRAFKFYTGIGWIKLY